MTSPEGELEIVDELYCYWGIVRLPNGRKFSAVAYYDTFPESREISYRNLKRYLEQKLKEKN